MTNEAESNQTSKPVGNEMRRIKRLFEHSESDKEDLISYAKEIVRLRAAARPAPDAGLVEREAITAEMVEQALSAWFASPPSETDQGLARSMKAALTAALSSRAVAGEPVAADAGERIRAAAVKLVMAGFMAQKHGLEDEIKKAERELLWFACDEISRHLERMPTPAPSGRDHCLKWQDVNGACPYGPPISSGRDPATIEAWQHVKTGGTYTVVGQGRIQAEEPLLDMEPVTIYRSDKDGSLWARHPDEFNDGRFVALAPARPAEVKP